MKKIPEPDLTGVEILTPAQMNKIHFGGNRTPLTPEQLKALADGKQLQNDAKGSDKK